MAPVKGRKSPRKSKTTTTTKATKIAQAAKISKAAPAKPRLCRICPDRPLKAECACPRRGKARIPSADSADGQEPDLSVPESPPSTPVPQRHVAVTNLDARPVTPPPATPPASPAGSTPPASPTSTTSSPKKKRVTPSTVNAVYGYVNGASRGSKPAEIARTRKVEPPFDRRKDASRAFRAQTNDLLTRCESLADRSAAWVYIAMQHPGGKKPFVHFASRKIRREAPKELEQVHSAVSGMMKLLMKGDRAKDLDTVRLHMETEEKLKTAERAATEAERAANAIAEENAALKAQLAEHNAQIAARDALLKTRTKKRAKPRNAA